jgi:hypothetical protein
MPERNTIKLLVQVCLRMNTLMFETCRGQYISVKTLVYIKVKQSRNRPGVAQRVAGGLGSQTSMTFGT